MIKKTLFFSAVLAACMALFAGPASAQYPPTVFEAEIDDVTVVAGQSVTISGTCIDGDDDVAISIEGGASLGSIDVDDDGSFSGDVTIPSDLAPGDYTVLAECGGEVLEVEITVVASGGGGQTGGNMGDDDNGAGSGSDDDDDALARTGTEVDGLVKVGGGLLVAGAAAVLFATKRRSATV